MGEPRLKVVDPNGTERYADTGMPVNEVWDACVEALGYEPLTVSEKALWGRMTRSLQGANADRTKIVAVAEWYHRRWPDIDLTITALEKWYSHFLRMHEKKQQSKEKASLYCDYCGGRNGTHARDCVRPRG